MFPTGIHRHVLACALLTSCAAASVTAQTATPPQGADSLIQQGITALHHFEYDDANAAFLAAERLEPASVPACIGEALTYDQVLWRLENVDAGRRALARLGPSPAARAARAVNPRDRGLLAAVEALFGDGDSPTRHSRYEAALAALTETYPADADIAAWYALARLATASRGLIAAAGAHDAHDAQLAGSPLQKEVAGILEKVLAAEPKHPGALHYLLHAYDDPEHARLALDAARTYAGIAQGASHALHMPSHIFLQLGLWHDAAASDRAAFDASTARGKRLHLNPALRNFHALSWLQYELLQLGRYAEAQRVIDEMQAAVDARKALPDSESRGGHQPLQSNLSSMRARFAIETRRWELLASEEQFGNVDELLGIGLSAVRTGNKAVADRVRQALALRATSPEEGDLRPSIAIMEGEIAGMLALKYGARGEGISMLESAARSEMALPPPFGPPQPVKPATELFAEMMMEIERPSDAVEWYEHTLRRHPNRTLAVLGLARAHLAAGQPAAAATRYRELLANLDGADAGRPEIAEARRALETAPPPAPAPPPERPYAWIIAIVAAAGIAAIGVATTVAKKNRRKSRRTRRTQRTPRPGRP